MPPSVISLPSAAGLLVSASAAELSPEHISAYGLILEESTPFFSMEERGVFTGELSLPDEETEAEKGSRVYDPMPKPPTYSNPPTRYQRRKDEEAHDRAMEQWEARRIHRELKAAQKRKERIQRRLREL